jgi:hypothetical protein
MKNRSIFYRQTRWDKLKQCFIRIVISRYIKKFEKHWKVEKGDEIVIGTNDKGTLDIWLIGKDDSWIYLEEIQ